MCLYETKALVTRPFLGRTVAWPLQGVEMSGTVIVSCERPRRQRPCNQHRRCIARIGSPVIILAPLCLGNST